MRPQQAPVSGKVFIQRDYSSGTRCQFQTKFPAELENRVRRLSPRTCPGAREGDFTGVGRGYGPIFGPLNVLGFWGGADRSGLWTEVYEEGSISAWRRKNRPNSGV
jgi:hypothetical protein